MKPKIGDAVLVEWENSQGGSTSSWQDLPTADHCGEPSRTRCRSVGWLIYRSRKAVVVVPHLAENPVLALRQGCGDMTIPTAAIVQITRLDMNEYK